MQSHAHNSTFDGQTFHPCLRRASFPFAARGPNYGDRERGASERNWRCCSAL